jgi:hypothetical protein
MTTYLTLTPVAASKLGVDCTPADLTAIGSSNAGVEFANAGNVGVLIYNNSGSSVNVTPQVQRNIEGLGALSTLASSAGAVALTTGKMWLFGSYSPLDYNIGGAPGGLMIILVSGTLTSVYAAAITIPITSP